LLRAQRAYRASHNLGRLEAGEHSTDVGELNYILYNHHQLCDKIVRAFLIGSKYSEDVVFINAEMQGVGGEDLFVAHYCYDSEYGT
jgi:hypothetical protein